MGQTELPRKPYFRIGEVADLLGVETYVLRYWEGEFPQLKPVRAPSRQRLYKRPDVQQLLVIKDLLHNQGYTIAGARRLLELAGQTPPAPPERRLKAAPEPPASPQPPHAAGAAGPHLAAAPSSSAATAAPGPAGTKVPAEVLEELRSILKLLA